MYDNFQIVKDALDIVEVAEYYGISVNRHNKAHCPWHDDRHPSLSFKKQRFKCFSCDEGGDVIDLARLLTNAATPLVYIIFNAPRAYVGIIPIWACKEKAADSKRIN